jgi:hypothetical protein
VDGLEQLTTIGQLTAPGVLLVVVLLIIRAVVRGDLVPRATVDALLRGRDGEIERAVTRGNDWQAAFEAQRHRGDLLAEQNRELIEVARSHEHLVETVEALARRGGDTSPAPAAPGPG